MFYWVHTCIQRRDVIPETLTSLDTSDVPSYEVWEHPDTLCTGDEIERWWEERLLEAAGRGKFFVRLEDDVLVSRTLDARLSRWSATQEQDFGVGLLYRWVGSPMDDWNVDRSGMFPRVQDPYHMSAQGMVFRSDRVLPLVKQMREIRKTRMFQRIGNLNFDTVLGQACHKLGLSVYLHEPSLVDCRDVGSINQPGAQSLCAAKDFSED